MTYEWPTTPVQPRRVVVVGRSGRTAQALARQKWPKGFEVMYAGRDSLNILDFEAVLARVLSLAPDIIINTAAYTDVDGAEADHQAASLLNAEAPGWLAEAAYAAGSDFYHLSTDFVFGEGRGPRTEAEKTVPFSHYGTSKREGELRVLSAHPGATIIRTAWLFDGYSPNFVTTLLNLADRSELRVVSDQIGSPTHTDHLAQGMIELLQKSQENRPEILHLVNEGRASRMDQARAIFEALETHAPKPKLNPILASDWPTAAQRPGDSQLSTQLWQELGLTPLPSWQAAVSLAVQQWLGRQKGQA